jgi:hypothetical protein
VWHVLWHKLMPQNIQSATAQGRGRRNYIIFEVHQMRTGIYKGDLSQELQNTTPNSKNTLHDILCSRHQ